jgi:hypothetical protein
MSACGLIRKEDILVLRRNICNSASQGVECRQIVGSKDEAADAITLWPLESCESFRRGLALAIRGPTDKADMMCMPSKLSSAAVTLPSSVRKMLLNKRAQCAHG